MIRAFSDYLRCLPLRHLSATFLLSALFVACVIQALADYPFFAGLVCDYRIAALFIISTYFLFLILRMVVGAGSLVILAAGLGIFFWPFANGSFSRVFPILVAGSTAATLFFIFRSKSSFSSLAGKEKKYVWVLAVVYALFLIFAALRIMDSLSFFNTRDFATYNQTFWNTIHGRLFENSAYGSNLACHNTWFYLALVPVYYILPYPATLLVLKIALLALAVLPYYLCIRDALAAPSRIVMAAVFLFSPYIIAQAFTPPHEIGFAPFFALCTYYFFKRNAFWRFAACLLILLTIKEHLALVSVMFGVYAFFSKKTARWVVVPIAVGAAWAVFSYLVIAHFQHVYQSNADANWFLTNLKTWIATGGSAPGFILGHSNFSSWFRFKAVFSLFAPLGFILPLAHPVSIIGLPEVMLNLISDRPGMFTPQGHYNIVAVVFLLIACAEGISKVSRFKQVSLAAGKVQLICSVAVLSLTLLHAYTWLPLVRIRNAPVSRAVLKAALQQAPPGAFVTVEQDAALLASSRRNYSLLESGVLGDFVLTDRPQCPLQLSPGAGFILVYAQGGACLYKRVGLAAEKKEEGLFLYD